MKYYTKVAGIDVHKSTIAVALAEGQRLPPISYGLIESTPEAVTRQVATPGGRLFVEQGEMVYYLINGYLSFTLPQRRSPLVDCGPTDPDSRHSALIP